MKKHMCSCRQKCHGQLVKDDPRIIILVDAISDWLRNNSTMDQCYLAQDIYAGLVSDGIWPIVQQIAKNDN